VKERLTLKPRQPDLALPPEELIGTAIRTRTCVRALYNRTAIRMGPHALYRRNDDLFVDGVVFERDGVPPREPKLGTFKLDGLKELASALIRFEPQGLFDPDAEKYAVVEMLSKVEERTDAAPRRRPLSRTG